MTPRTEAGRALDRWIEQAVVTTDEARAGHRREVVEAEAEARQQAFDEAIAAVRAMDGTEFEDGHSDPVEGLTRDSVLAAITEARQR